MDNVRISAFREKKVAAIITAAVKFVVKKLLTVLSNKALEEKR